MIRVWRSNRAVIADTDVRGQLPVVLSDRWIFGYGSLMWRPEVSFTARVRATASGFNRGFYVASTHHRGTEARPGLVLGLDRGGACIGIAYRIADTDWPGTLAYLRERELIYGVYREAIVPLVSDDAQHANFSALTYIVERRHPSYAGRLPLAEQARRIRSARGISGTNLDYLINTVEHLGELAIRERRLERLLALCGGIARRERTSGLARASSQALCRAWAARTAPIAGLTMDQRRRFGYRCRLAAG